MSAFPRVRVLLECLHPHKVVEAVLNDEADLGILSYPATSRALQVLPLREEPMVVVTHPSHRLAPPRRVTPAAPPPEPGPPGPAAAGRADGGRDTPEPSAGPPPARDPRRPRRRALRGLRPTPPPF